MSSHSHLVDDTDLWSLLTDCISFAYFDYFLYVVVTVNPPT